MNTNSNLRHRIAIAAAVIAAGGGMAFAAAPGALAATPGTGGGSVPASITIPASITLSLGAGSSGLNFTGSSGGISNFPTVAYTTSDNDSAGIYVNVAVSSATFADGAGNTFPASDVGVWGPAQENIPADGQTANNNVTEGGVNFTGTSPEQLATSPVTTYATTAAGTGGATDTYGFVGPAVGEDWQTQSTPFTIPGSDIPSAPAGTYADTIAYSIFGN
jgi:hypothetical protein